MKTCTETWTDHQLLSGEAKTEFWSCSGLYSACDLKGCAVGSHIPAADGRLAEAAGEEKSAKSPMRSELPTVNNQDDA